MDSRPGKDKRARTNEDERKRTWDALIKDNKELLCPADDEPTQNLHCLVCEQVLRGTGATYSIGNARVHMLSNVHKNKVREVNESRSTNGQAPLPDFIEKTQEELTGQVSLSSDATRLCSLPFPASLYGDVLTN